MRSTLALVLLAGALLLAPPAAQAQTVYHNWATLTLDLQGLVAEHPDIARLHSAGKSVGGLDLWYVEITNFLADAPPMEERPVLYLDGGTHANEQLGMELAYLTVAWLLENYGKDANATYIVDHRHLYVLPMVNPDGNLLDSRTNARGVNINRNFPYAWGHDGATNTPGGNYRGPYAASEPETRAVMGLIDSIGPVYAQSYHTGIVMALYPWGWTEDAPPDNATFAAICDELVFEREACGQVSTTLYVASGNTIDYAYHEHGAVAWTFEVSDEGSMPLNLGTVAAAVPEGWHGTLHALLHVDRYGGLLRIEDAALGGGATAPVLRAVLRNDGLGPARDVALWAEVAGQAVPLAAGLEIPAGEARAVEAAMPALADGAAVALRAEYKALAQREAPATLRGDFAAALRTGGLDLVPRASGLDALVPADAGGRATPGPAAPLALLALAAVALAARRRA